MRAFIKLINLSAFISETTEGLYAEEGKSYISTSGRLVEYLHREWFGTAKQRRELR